MPAVAQHIRLDLQRNLLGWDGEKEEERPALGSGMQEAGGGKAVGTG